MWKQSCYLYCYLSFDCSFTTIYCRSQIQACACVKMRNKWNFLSKIIISRKIYIYYFKLLLLFKLISIVVKFTAITQTYLFLVVPTQSCRPIPKTSEEYETAPIRYDMSIFERDGHEAVAAQTDQCFAFQYKQYYWNKAGGTEV